MNKSLKMKRESQRVVRRIILVKSSGRNNTWMIYATSQKMSFTLKPVSANRAHGQFEGEVFAISQSKLQNPHWISFSKLEAGSELLLLRPQLFALNFVYF